MVAQGEFESLFKGSIDKINITPGSIVNAKVIEIRNDYVIINAGLKSEGVINKNQFLDPEGNLEIKVGDIVEVTLDILFLNSFKLAKVFSQFYPLKFAVNSSTAPLRTLSVSSSRDFVDVIFSST